MGLGSLEKCCGLGVRSQGFVINSCPLSQVSPPERLSLLFWKTENGAFPPGVTYLGIYINKGMYIKELKIIVVT